MKRALALILALMMPHRVCKACGTYNGKQVINVEG